MPCVTQHPALSPGPEGVPARSRGVTRLLVVLAKPEKAKGSH